MPRSDRPDPSDAPYDPPGGGAEGADDVVAGAGAGDGGNADEVLAKDVTADVLLAARVARIAREVDDDDFARQAPPAEVWDRIAAAVSLGAPEDAPTAGGEAGPGLSGRADESASADVVSIEGRHRQMNRSVMIAVAASVVLFAALGFLFTRGDSSPDPQLVATAELAQLEEPAADGAAADVRLVRDGEVQRLVLTARDMGAAPADHHYELWLLDPSTASAEPVSLGTMSGSVTVPVPADVDLEAYQVVDVSVQAEGQVEHSGNSVLRGTLA